MNVSRRALRHVHDVVDKSAVYDSITKMYVAQFTAKRFMKEIVERRRYHECGMLKLESA
jgi:hypothetical protein